MRPSFVRVEPWLQAGKYVGAVMSSLPKRNGWSIAQHVGDRTPDRTSSSARLRWPSPAPILSAAAAFGFVVFTNA
jgi:hypothetical protein